jgi:condensin complex subunit 3
MALNSFQLFINQVQETHEALRIQVLKIIYDVLMVHEDEFLGRGVAVSSRYILSFILVS